MVRDTPVARDGLSLSSFFDHFIAFSFVQPVASLHSICSFVLSFVSFCSNLLFVFLHFFSFLSGSNARVELYSTSSLLDPVRLLCPPDAPPPLGARAATDFAEAEAFINYVGRLMEDIEPEQETLVCDLNRTSFFLFFARTYSFTLSTLSFSPLLFLSSWCCFACCTLWAASLTVFFFLSFTFLFVTSSGCSWLQFLSSASSCQETQSRFISSRELCKIRQFMVCLSLIVIACLSLIGCLFHSFSSSCSHHRFFL